MIIYIGQQMIQVRKSCCPRLALSAEILITALAPEEKYAFSMCNPPFFSSWEEAGQNPNTAFQGTPTEMVCPGGELAFVEQMIQDSIQLQVD